MTEDSAITMLKSKDHVLEHGYAFIKACRPEMDVLSLAEVIGQPLVPWEGRTVQNLVPHMSAEKNTYSGMYGFGRFPFHTLLVLRQQCWANVSERCSGEKLERQARPKSILPSIAIHLMHIFYIALSFHK